MSEPEKITWDPIQREHDRSMRTQLRIYKITVFGTLVTNLSLSALEGFKTGALSSGAVLAIGGLAIWDRKESESLEVDRLKIRATSLFLDAKMRKAPAPEWVNGYFGAVNTEVGPKIVPRSTK